MREQLAQYVNLLFAGAADCKDIKQEILQNTLDRYDDLIAEGKVPEAAYRMAITGIGDISEILDTCPSFPSGSAAPVRAGEQNQDSPIRMLLRAVAIGLYILCPIPLFVLSELGLCTLGLCSLLGMVAVATVLIVLGGKKDPVDRKAEEVLQRTPQTELEKSISNIIWALGLALYFIVSFSTGGWYITWIIFPITGAFQGLANAIFDLKEATKYEK